MPGLFGEVPILKKSGPYLVPISEKSGPYLVPFRDFFLVGPNLTTLLRAENQVFVTIVMLYTVGFLFQSRLQILTT